MELFVEVFFKGKHKAKWKSEERGRSYLYGNTATNPEKPEKKKSRLYKTKDHRRRGRGGSAAGEQRSW